MRKFSFGVIWFGLLCSFWLPSVQGGGKSVISYLTCKAFQETRHKINVQLVYISYEKVLANPQKIFMGQNKRHVDECLSCFRLQVPFNLFARSSISLGKSNYSSRKFPVNLKFIAFTPNGKKSNRLIVPRDFYQLPRNIIEK